MAFKRKTKVSGSAEKQQISKQEILPPVKKKPAHLFVKGQSGNPAGRQRGSRNKFAEEFFKDFHEDWKKHGVKALQDCRKEDPAVYCRIAASLIPKELNIKEGDSILDSLLEQFDDDQLDQFLVALAGISAAGQGKETKAKALPRK